MKFLLPFVMLTVCAATPQDLSGKMFTFPQETNTAHVKLNTARGDFSAVTVCLRSFTDLKRAHALFSLATSAFQNGFRIMKDGPADQLQLNSRNEFAKFDGQDYKPNTWHSACATWESQSGLQQLWLDGKYSSRKFTSSGSPIPGTTITTLGQEQDSFGGGFDAKESFVGMLSDVHMWDYVLSPCEIQHYMDEGSFTSGNVLNWRALEFQIIGKVLLENKQICCNP